MASTARIISSHHCLQALRGNILQQVAKKKKKKKKEKKKEVT